MASIFTRIIDGELPGRFVWRDPECVAFLSIAPLKPGHTLVVPRRDVDHWLDVEPNLNQHLWKVAQSVGRGVMQAFRPVKVGTIVLGLEVPHTHIHVVPIWGPRDLDFDNADANAAETELDAAARQLRDALRALGYAEVSD